MIILSACCLLSLQCMSSWGSSLGSLDLLASLAPEILAEGSQIASIQQQPASIQPGPAAACLNNLRSPSPRAQLRRMPPLLRNHKIRRQAQAVQAQGESERVCCEVLQTDPVHLPVSGGAQGRGKGAAVHPLRQLAASLHSGAEEKVCWEEASFTHGIRNSSCWSQGE